MKKKFYLAMKHVSYKRFCWIRIHEILISFLFEYSIIGLID